LRRVVVFVDYQNLYMLARRRFCPAGAPAWHGQLDPGALGELLVARSMPGSARVLTGVRVYRGMPSPDHDPKAYGAWRRQVESWGADPRVTVVARPLRYPRSYPRVRPQEKGVDVRLAVDFVAMAIQGAYDVGVLVSQDSDLLPALEAVAHLRDGPSCEVTAWAGRGIAPRLRIPGAALWCHYLTAADYAAVADPRDYTRS
jgi:NYN domain